MCLAEHLAVAFIRRTAFAPRQYVVGIHFFQCPDFVLVGTVSTGTEGTVADVLLLCLVCLFAINTSLDVVIENSYVQKFCVLASPKDILKHVLVVFDTWVVIQFFHLFRNHNMVIWCGVVSFVELSPVQSFHLWIDVIKGLLYP